MALASFFTADGQVLSDRTQTGVPGLLVSFYDLEGGADGTPAELASLLKRSVRIGSTITDAAGRFAFNYTAEDIAAARPDKKRLDLFIVVSAPDTERSGAEARVIYVSSPPRLQAGRVEHFAVVVSHATLVKLGLASDESPGASDSAAKRRVEAYIRSKSELLGLSSGVADFHRTLTDRDQSARKAFRANFRKLIATDFELVKPNGVFVPEGQSIQGADKISAESAIDRANGLMDGDTGGVPVTLYLTQADRDRLFGDQTTGQVQIPEHEVRLLLLDAQRAENAGAILIQNNPILKYCREHSTEETCATDHLGLPSGGHEDGGGPPAPDDGDGATTIGNDNIREYLARLVDDMPVPDSVLRPELTKDRANRTTLQQSVDEFTLGRGPADVTAFYDFHSLQIAFDFVWRQLLDEEIINLAYRANTEYRARFGADIAFTGNGFLQVHGLEWLPPVFDVPPNVAAHFDITKEEYNDLSIPMREKLGQIADNIDARYIFARTDPTNPQGVVVTLVQDTSTKNTVDQFVQDQKEQAERIIDTVRHDEYYSLHKTLRDLQARIKSQYEFTVFAADKDYHSVNFGLLNTYRQRWEPLCYQAGKLVKTLPLSPKEERRYTLKVTRTLKHATKEALKNNSSFTSEQSSTSRVEAEIVSKAQNKTNFNLSAEGTYNIGISKGDSKTSFGVEAQSESAQNRKDFREAVIKAAQEYKEERSSEVSTDEEVSSEYTESGTVINPNDELAVTYLFYELQRRYRLSEQLYRVMPVVLVAQEVPAPEAITEAWVIAHDWILNRFLLDNSFRPCLQYLSTKSVGDDFAVRELRKNLREQRALVNRLKIELSKASSEADSRYRALENAINVRIAEESAERTDGWFSDVADFFSGNGQNPEGAKARELAAKDAHQYAVEKAAQLATSLQQEVSNLRAITAEYNKTVRARLDNEAQVKRLLVHIRNNILYYMQSIWSMEPPDQRLLRLHKVLAPDLVADGERTCTLEVEAERDVFAQFRAPGTTRHRGRLRGRLEKPVQFKPLAEIADLDNMLGFKGNYMIFPLKRHNALTELMAAPYIDAAFGAMDPDQLSNVSLEDYSRYVCCLHDRLSPEEFEAQKPLLIEWLKQLLSDPLRNGDEIVVPTDSLFIEALPGEHPLLEDYKLRHRELDVFKVQAEVRRAEMENLRLAARLVNEEREDPDIERKIVVQGAATPLVNDA